MEISSSDLNKMLLVAIENIKRYDVNVYTIHNDYYWTISAEDAVVMEKDLALAVGSLIDDWANLEKVINGKQTFTTVDLDRIVSILTFISKEIAA